MGNRSRRLLVALVALLLAACGDDSEREVSPRGDSYFLWAGVPAPPELGKANSVYVLSGEVRASAPGEFVPLRSQPPTAQRPDVWLVVRTETLDWDEVVFQRVERDLAQWDASTNLIGLQIDFNSGTRNLDRYGEFLHELRGRLPADYRLSITGLLDWSANGDPATLAKLAGVVDEVVVQTYQGRNTIPGYESYQDKLKNLPFDYRIGIVEDGRWHGPGELADDPHYRGTVVFLTRP